MAAAKSREEILLENQRLREEIEKKHGKTPEQLYQEREKRLFDAVQMKVPDRVPVVFGGTFFPCKYAGIPYSAAYYDAEAWKYAYRKVLLDFEPDGYGVAGAESGLALEVLDSNYTLWPGGKLPPDVGLQVVEDEFEMITVRLDKRAGARGEAHPFNTSSDVTEKSFRSSRTTNRLFTQKTPPSTISRLVSSSFTRRCFRTHTLPSSCTV